MPKVSRTQIFPFSRAEIYAVIADIEQYPKFVEGVEKIKVLQRADDGKWLTAQYSINIVKNFTYTINMSLNPQSSISWVLESGDLFKKNDGRWELREISEKETEVVYSLDVEFKLFAPSFIVDKLVSQSLPQMMRSFESRVRDLHRKQIEAKAKV